MYDLQIACQSNASPTETALSYLRCYLLAASFWNVCNVIWARLKLELQVMFLFSQIEWRWGVHSRCIEQAFKLQKSIEDVRCSSAKDF